MNRRNLEPTRILDCNSPATRRFAESVRAQHTSPSAFLEAAHAKISREIRPVYTVHERQSVSTTIEKRRGSCSQRLACLEALARWHQIGTRVRALWVSGRFWNNRFPIARLFIPRRVLLAWPQFFVDGYWRGAEAIYGPLESRAADAIPFANDGETLFEAVRSTVIDFDGRTRICSKSCDLSRFVVARGTVFDVRDDLFDQLGHFEDTWKGKAFERLYGDRSSV
ncbi:MAG: transglutaminase domain-containing protein [Vicinamibacterales bacterium]